MRTGSKSLSSGMGPDLAQVGRSRKFELCLGGPHHRPVPTAAAGDRAGATKKPTSGAPRAGYRKSSAGLSAATLPITLLWLGRLVAALLLALALGYLPYKLYLRSGLVQYVSLRGELAALTARNEQLQSSIRELRHQLERMKEDPAAIERVARDELGMVRSGEVVFKVE